LRQTAIGASENKRYNSSDHFLAMSAMDPKMVDPSHNRQSDAIRAVNLRRKSPTTQTTMNVSRKRKNTERNQTGAKIQKSKE
jgi:hypothetical protein